ncbi:MAG: pseudouridine synthase [Oscillospiraceae bacterium]
MMKQRLQKIIAGSGVCSRRAAEALISEGKVRVNGVVAIVGETADDETDEITIDNSPIPRAGGRTYIMLNKPRGYVTSMSDEHGRKTVADLVADVGVRVYPVGRLDMNSEGLLIMTDDGELANLLMHPSHEVKKIYQTRVRGENIDKALEILRSPLIIDGTPINPAEVKLLSDEGNTAVISICISEGRNRQVRKMCEMAELYVLRLKRCSEGGLTLGTLPVGKWRYLKDDEILKLQKHRNI